MSTVIRATISKKNEYYISKHRYYELKHFCLQYPEWLKEYKAIDYSSKAIDPSKERFGANIDITAEIALKRDYLRKKMEMVEQAALSAAPELVDYILMAVTEGSSYEYLKMNKNIPCSRDMFYNRYRKFFWILSRVR